MTFLAAPRLWLLVAVVALAVAYVVLQRRRRTYAVRFTNLALLDAVAPRRPAWRRHVPAVAMLLTLATLVTAFARPARDERVPAERATVVMAIDVSLSMEADDVEPSRIAAAKTAATTFVDRVPPTLNLALVTFAGTAAVVVPPTREHDQVREAIDRLELAPRTAIGEAIYTALASIASQPLDGDGVQVPGRVVLMSDGETTTGRPNEEAVEAASVAGVAVTTIAYGTDEGTVTVEGQTVPVPVNGEALRDIADGTGGAFYEATTGDELRSVYSDIGSAVGYDTEQREISAWFVGLALALAMASAATSLLWFGRLP